MEIVDNAPIRVGYPWKLYITLYPIWLYKEIADNVPIQVGYPWKLQITNLSELVIHGNCI